MLESYFREDHFLCWFHVWSRSVWRFWQFYLKILYRSSDFWSWRQWQLPEKRTSRWSWSCSKILRSSLCSLRWQTSSRGPRSGIRAKGWSEAIFLRWCSADLLHSRILICFWSGESAMRLRRCLLMRRLVIWFEFNNNSIPLWSWVDIFCSKKTVHFELTSLFILKPNDRQTCQTLI